MTDRLPSSRSILVNVFSISASRAWQAALQFLVTPIYIALLGADAYGLVAFNATLLMTLLFLDQFINPLLIREFGRLSAKPNAAPEMRNLLRSLEYVSFGTGIVVGLAIMLAAPLFAGNWLTASSLKEADVETAVRLIGLSILCQWPSFLYAGGFIALHRQDLLGLIRVVFSTLQAAGGVLLLWLVSPSIALLLVWQAATFAVQIFVLNRTLWSALPSDTRPPHVDVDQLRSVWRFAAGTLIIAAVSSLLSQADKLIVSKSVSLDRFSAYSIAASIVLYLTFLAVWPVTHTLQPHFARLIAQDDNRLLAQEYHRWTQIVAVIVLSVFGPLAVYGRPVLEIWLGAGSPLVDPAAGYLFWFAFGYVFSNLVAMASLLQLAAGWVRLSVVKNAIAAVIFVPAVYFGIGYYGPVAGAVCWFLLNLAFFVIEIPIMHRRLLPRELWSWWGIDTIFPTTFAAAILFVSMKFAPSGGSHWTLAIYAAITGAVICGLLTLCLPHARAQAERLFLRVNAALRDAR